MWVRLGVYWDVLLQESLWVGPALAAVGAVFLSWPARRKAILPAAWLLVCDYVLYMAVFHYLANLDPNNPLFMGVQARFWQQANLLVFVWAGIGLYAVGCGVSLKGGALKKH